MNSHRIGGDLFEMHCEPIDVTSMHRPDTSWRFVDAHGHEHRWFVGGKPADQYSPTLTYETPTLVWIKDGDEYWDDDDEPHPVGHLECIECGEHIAPRYTADSYTQYIPGPKSCRINGERVGEEEFMRRVEEARKR